MLFLSLKQKQQSRTMKTVTANMTAIITKVLLPFVSIAKRNGNRVYYDTPNDLDPCDLELTLDVLTNSEIDALILVVAVLVGGVDPELVELVGVDVIDDE